MEKRFKNTDEKAVVRRFNKREDNVISETEGRTIKGYSAVFGDIYEVWEDMRETIAPGAFDGCDMTDVVALFNHDSENLLARVKDGKGTLTLKVDEKGLYFEFDAPNTTIGNDVLENVKLENIRGCSFAFTVREDNWEEKEDGTILRTIVKVKKLYDVGPVVNPAYEATEIEACKRSVDAFKESKKPQAPSADYYLVNKIKFNL